VLYQPPSSSGVTLRSGLAVLDPSAFLAARRRVPPTEAGDRRWPSWDPANIGSKKLITLNGEATYDSRPFDFEVVDGR
jgi:hypothetical protein